MKDLTVPKVTLSVIIPVYNSYALLKLCLKALKNSDITPDEVIIVDDGSTQELKSMTQEDKIKWIRIENGPKGPAYARNRGVEIAKSEILVFIDSDVMVHPDTLHLIQKKFQQDTTLSAIFGSYDDSPVAKGIVSQFRNLLHHYIHQQNGGKAYTFWAGCGAIKKKIFKELGGFNQTYQRPSIEDIELGYRLSLKGHLIELCPEIQVTHLKQWTLANMIKTDIFARAIPWTKLLHANPNIPYNLNVDTKSRFSAGIAGLLFISLVTMIFNPQFSALFLSLFILQLIINYDLFRFFLIKKNLGFLTGAILLYDLYLIYSSLTYIITSFSIKLK